MVKIEIRYPGLIPRVIADFIDSFFIDLVSFLLLFVWMAGTYWVRLRLLHSLPESASFFESSDPLALQIVFVLFRGGLSLGYYFWGTYRFGTTLGKRIFRIYVISAADLNPISLKQSLIRCLSYLASYLPMGAGFWMIAFHPERKGLHDLIAGTVSIRKD